MRDGNGKGYHSGYFWRAINKYGWDNFEHIILQAGLSESVAKYLERYYIRYFDTKKPNGYNLTDGGDGTLGWCPDENFRSLQSKIQKEQWQDDEYRNRIITMRKAEDSPYRSEKFRNKISVIVSGENNPNYGNHWSDEQKEALRQKQKQNPMYNNETNPNAKRIMCVETGEEFDCIKYAMEKYKIKSHGSITVALKYPTRTAGGVYWKLI